MTERTACERKCPFDEEDFDIEMDEPCPTCGITGHELPFKWCVKYVTMRMTSEAMTERTGHRVTIDDYSWFEVMFDEGGEPDLVIECRVVWTPKRGPDNKLMSERIRRAIEQARRALEKP